MIYMLDTGINYYKLAVEKDRDSIFTTMWKPCFIVYISTKSNTKNYMVSAILYILK
jgi:hypothetical protein